MREKPWSRIKDQNSVDKEFLEIVGSGKPTGSVLKETIVVSVTISISVQNWHSRILRRVLSCGRMREMRREPEVPEARDPVVECFDGPARITSKELATTHFVKGGILQNAYSTSPRVDVGLGKSAFICTARLKNSLAKGPTKWWQKCSGHVDWRRMICTTAYGNLLSTMLKVTIDQGDLMKSVITSWNEDLLDVDHLTHDNWVVYFKTWSRRSLFSGRAQTCRFIKYTTIGLRIPGYGAAEVFIEFTEELRQTETDPMCKNHESHCTSR